MRPCRFLPMSSGSTVSPVWLSVSRPARLRLRTALDSKKTAAGGVPVAVAHPYGRGRFVYVGFTFENIVAAKVTSAFEQLLASAGWPPSGGAPGAAPRVVKDVSATRLSPPITPAVSSLNVAAPNTALIQPPTTRAIGGSDPVVLSPTPVSPIKQAALTEAVMKDVEFDNWGFEKRL